MKLSIRERFQPNILFNAAALLPGILGCVSAAFMSYVFLWPPTPAYEVSKASEHRVTYEHGLIRTHRAYCINAEVPITIHRDLVLTGNPNAVELRLSLPQTTQVYPLGCHDIDRIFTVPRGIPYGNYRLVNIATWQANTFRSGLVKLPELFVAIPKTDD